MTNRILVVDDDEGVREYVHVLLSREGLDVVSASDGEEGMKLLDEAQPDLVLLDVTMPGTNGLELLRRIKQDHRELPVVMLSGQGEAANVVESLRYGAADFLDKPFEPEALLVAVERALTLRTGDSLCPHCHGAGRIPNV